MIAANGSLPAQLSALWQTQSLLFLSLRSGLGLLPGLGRRLFGGLPGCLFDLRCLVAGFASRGPFAAFGLRLGLRLRALARLGAFGQDFRNADQDEILPVAALAPRILAAALLEGDHLAAANVIENLGRDARARDH